MVVSLVWMHSRLISHKLKCYHYVKHYSDVSISTRLTTKSRNVSKSEGKTKWRACFRIKS